VSKDDEKRVGWRSTKVWVTPSVGHLMPWQAKVAKISIVPAGA